MSAQLYVQLLWEDPSTGKLNSPLLTPPIAIGREKEQMPERLGEYAVSSIELVDNQISRYHALISVANGQMYITDISSNGTYLNGRLISKGSKAFSSKDTLRIGSYKITASLMAEKDLNATELSREAVNIGTSNNILAKNTILIWFLGIVLLLLMSLGVWLLVTTILKNTRPQVAPTTNSSSLLILK